MPSILGANSVRDNYQIDNSLRTGGGDNHHLSMVYGSSASNRKTFTFSSWFKLGQAAHFTEYYDDEKYLFTSTDAAQSTTNVGYGGYTSGNAGGFHFQDGRSGTYIETTSKFRDPSAWYHVVVRYDSTQSTASDRIFIYVNGVSQPLNYSNSGDPEVDLNTEVDFFLAGDNIDATSADSGNFVHNVNSYYNSGFGAANNSFDGHFADMYLINAQSLPPTAFGKTDINGVWIPIKYGGTFNAHSFKLEFQQTGSSANSSGIGADTSGQDNHFKVGVNSTLAATDVTTDTPTNNFATMNPLAPINGGAPSTLPTFSEGNTQITVGDGTTRFATGTFATSMPYYFEVKVSAISGSDSDQRIGIIDGDAISTSTTYNSVYQGGGVITATGESNATGKDTLTANDIIGVAVDLATNNNIKFYENGDLQATMSVGASYQGLTSTPFARLVNATTTFQFNFGNPPFAISSGNADANGYGNFEYAVPSGYYSLCTKNLAEYG